MTTDSTLLGAWANPQGTKALDVGTGCGVLALMLAQRNLGIRVWAVDIDPVCVQVAQGNFAASPWSDRLRAIEGDFLDVDFGHCFDLIWSNPPFFSQSLRAADKRKTIARHDDKLPLSGFFRRAALLLSPKGVCSLIVPAQECARVENLANQQGLFLNKKALIFTKPNFFKRAMLEFGFVKKELIIEQIVIGDAQRHIYDTSYKELLKDFLTVMP